jgi:hypothetical protein
VSSTDSGRKRIKVTGVFPSRSQAAPARYRLRVFSCQRALTLSRIHHRQQTQRETGDRVPAHEKPGGRAALDLPRLHHVQLHDRQHNPADHGDVAPAPHRRADPQVPPAGQLRADGGDSRGIHARGVVQRGAGGHAPGPVLRGLHQRAGSRRDEHRDHQEHAVQGLPGGVLRVLQGDRRDYRRLHVRNSSGKYWETVEEEL